MISRLRKQILHGVMMSAFALTLGVPAFAGTTSGFVLVNIA
jgi:hypothetical protein